MLNNIVHKVITFFYNGKKYKQLLPNNHKHDTQPNGVLQLPNEKEAIGKSFGWKYNFNKIGIP
jgi:hypothetical protein